MAKLVETVNKIPQILKECTDIRWRDHTIYNHFDGPLAFMDSVLEHDGTTDNGSQGFIDEGKAAFKKIQEFNTSYDKIYDDVAKQVKGKLIARGFTTAMLYADVGFTSEKTGVMSKQRVMLGKKDCYFKNLNMTDGKLFHDIYINLSYSWSIADATITKNAYALYALTQAMSKLLPMRVIVVNHVGTKTPTCYSYVLKKFGQPIKPREFLFFTSASKRTFGWASYGILNEGRGDATVGEPTNTVSIASFSLDREIENLFNKVKAMAPELFQRVGK